MTTRQLFTAIPVLPTLDVRDSVAFYASLLDADDTFVWGDPPTYGGVRVGEISANGLEIGAVEVHFCRVAEASEIGVVGCRLTVADARALHRKLKRKNLVDPEDPLSDRAYGYREFSLIDPSGLRVTIAEPIP